MDSTCFENIAQKFTEGRLYRFSTVCGNITLCPAYGNVIPMTLVFFEHIEVPSEICYERRPICDKDFHTPISTPQDQSLTDSPWLTLSLSIQ